MEMDELKGWLRERIATLDGNLVPMSDFVRAKAYADVLSKLEGPSGFIHSEATEQPPEHPQTAAS